MNFTNFLFTQPSFIEGFGRVIDLSGSLDVYDYSLSPEEADALAIWSDWSAVGADMNAAIARFEREEALNPTHEPHGTV